MTLWRRLRRHADLALLLALLLLVVGLTLLLRPTPQTTLIPEKEQQPCAC